MTMEFSDLNLGDRRLSQRFLAVASALYSSPDETINKSIEEWSDKKAAYRLFSNRKFKGDELFECHQRQSAKRLNEQKRALVIHDSTYFSFNTKRSIKDLGSIGGEDTHGFIGHYSLGMSTGGLPLGLLGLMPWSRYYESPWEKESDRWVESFAETDKLKEASTEVIHVADREADIFDLHFNNLKDGRSFVIRSSHDRMIEGGDYYLSWHLEKKRVKGNAYIYDAKRKCNIPASLKFGEVEFTDPGVRYAPGMLRSAIRKVRLNVVEIKSDERGDGEEIRWVLFTNLPLNNTTDALKVVEYYRMRWHIENYFKVLKDGGCKVERCCLKNFDRLVKYAILFSIIAWRLYWLKHLSEVDPDRGIEIGFTEEEIILLGIKSKKNATDINLQEAMRIVAKMGGFNGRKGDGVPGMVSLWRGFAKLQAQVELFNQLKEIKYQF